jgi:hypothetical protein
MIKDLCFTFISLRHKLFSDYRNTHSDSAAMEGNLSQHSQHSQHSEQPVLTAPFSAQKGGAEAFNSVEAKLHAGKPSFAKIIYEEQVNLCYFSHSGEMAKGYMPSHSTISRSELTTWLNTALTGDLSEVPGIGHANQAHLFKQTADIDKSQGAGLGETVETTFQVSFWLSDDDISAKSDALY